MIRATNRKTTYAKPSLKKRDHLKTITEVVMTATTAVPMKQ